MPRELSKFYRNERKKRRQTATKKSEKPNKQIQTTEKPKTKTTLGRPWTRSLALPIAEW
jgi:hypothetical protein